MARNYSIEKHPHRRLIEKDLISGKPYSKIANDYDLPISCVKRYAKNKMADILRSASLDTVDGLIDRIVEYIEKVDKLYDSVSEWLTDPIDPTTFSSDPRADEIDVIYLKTAGNGKKVRAKAKLQDLVDIVQGEFQILTLYTNKVDNRLLMLKTAETLNKQLELLGKARGQIIDNIQVSTSEGTINDLVTIIQETLSPYPEALIALTEKLATFSSNVDMTVQEAEEEGI